MGRIRWFPIVLATLPLSLGCFRAASVHPSDMQQLSVEHGSAAIVYKNGDTRRIAHFDSITVEVNGAALQAMPCDPVASEDRSEFEFGRTTRGSLSASGLRLEDGRSRHVFALTEVENIRVERYSPERPWLILATASVGALAGGLLGYALGGPCNEEWGCLEKGLYAMAGAPIGFGLGLTVGFPLTRSLGELQRAPNDSRNSTTDAP